jgi:hypothetical protein
MSSTSSSRNGSGALVTASIGGFAPLRGWLIVILIVCFVFAIHLIHLGEIFVVASLLE